MRLRGSTPGLAATAALCLAMVLPPATTADARSPGVRQAPVPGEPVMLGDLAAGAASSMVGGPFFEFRGAGGRAYFGADDGVHGLEPWVSDGTASGTVLIGDLTPGGGDSDPTYFTPASHGVVFMTDTRTRSSGPLTGAIWATTATGTGGDKGTTTRLAQGRDVVSLDAAPLGGDAILATSDFDQNPQVWRSDGTVAGTVPLKRRLTLPDDLTPIGDVALFLDGQNPLWRTDGTPAGTRQVRRWGGQFGGVFVFDLTAVGRRAYFSVDRVDPVGRELWVSDGTRRGTRLVKDLWAGPKSSGPRWLTPDGNRLVFVANDGVHGRQLWRTRSSGRGMVRLTGLERAVIRQPTPCGSALYFVATDRRGIELWARSHGRVRRVADLAPGRAGSKPDHLTCQGDTLVFSANDGTHGRELWTVDGARARPVLHDLSPHGSSYPGALTELDGDVYFVANDGTHGREPWVLQGAG